MITLSQLKPAPGAVRKGRRLGRGPGSGRGKTAGRGMNGQKSRSGFSRKRGFEGGQMPLVRRVPKRGFTNIFRQRYAPVNLETLERSGLSEIRLADYYDKRLVKDKRAKIKILGQGTLKRKLVVEAHRFSQSAEAKIKQAGGEAIVTQGD